MTVQRTRVSVSRWAKTTAAIVVVGASFVYLGYNLRRGLQQVSLAELALRPLPVVAGLALYGLASLIGAYCWSLILEGLGQSLPLRINAKVHFSAAIAKYLPGYVWQILGKAYLCSQQGLAAGAVGLGIALEFASVILTGLWAVALALVVQWVPGLGLDFLRPWRWPALALLTGLCTALPVVLRRGLGRLGRRWRLEGVVVHPRPLWRMLVWMAVAWLVLGLTFHTLTAALFTLPASDLPFSTFCWTASSLFSLAVVFVPMGIGVKEGLLVLLLGMRVPVALATIIAVIARLVSMVMEALLFLIARRL